jgi:hypothetical protein
MARNWLDVLKTRGQSWGIPQQDMTELTALADAGDAILAKATKTERTMVITAECNAAFSALKEKMRWVKDRYFAEPPLTDSDLVALGLKPRDRTPSRIRQPDTEAEGQVVVVDFHRVGLRRIGRRGPEGSDSRSEYRVQIYAGVLGGSGPCRIDSPPHTGGDLRFLKATRRKREDFDFSGDSGKEVFFCMR